MLEKIVLTGAGGRLGSYIREPISKLCNILISTDIKENIGSLYKNEQYINAISQDIKIAKNINLYDVDASHLAELAKIN